MNTLFTGQNIIKPDACESVNTYAIELLKGVKVSEGTVVITDKQTAGRGQRGNVWYSEEGKNITMSIVYHPAFISASNSFLLSMMVSLALHDLLTEMLTNEHEVKIKWPNDIYVDGRKIAGILIENIYREEQIMSSVIGIGLNVNQTQFGQLQGGVNSLKLLIESEHSLKEVLEKVCESVERRYLQLRSSGADKIKPAYMERLYMREKMHEFKLSEGRTFKATIRDVRGDGKLVLQCENGEVRSFDVKEIAF